MRRLMQTIIPLPSMREPASRSAPRCLWRRNLIRCSLPTTASSAAHFVLSFSFVRFSSPSVTSSNSSSIFACSARQSPILASRLS